MRYSKTCQREIENLFDGIQKIKYNGDMETERNKTAVMPHYSEIPDVGLYLDQTAKFINGYLDLYPDMLVTTSMISNYAKQKLIGKLSRKTYSRIQIASLILVNVSKTVLSIQNVKTLLEDIRTSEDDFQSAYEKFRQVLEDTLGALYENKQISIGAQGEGTSDMLSATVVAIAHKMYLEQYFASRKENPEN